MAIDKITTAAITDGTIVTADIADANVTAAKLASGTVQNQSAFKNIIINGDMSQAQRATSTSSITNDGYYTIDRFQTFNDTLGTWTQSQSTTVPTGQGFATSLKMDCTTADASPAAGDRLGIRQRFEGQNMQYLKYSTSSAQSTTLSFWVRSNKTGTYIAELYGVTDNRQISKSYTISSADTWEKKEITFDGDTGGTYNNDNSNELIISWYLGAGSNYTSGTLSTTWGAKTDANRAVGQVNLADSTSNEWYVTGVQLEAGTSASDFEFLPVDVNLNRCKRYFQLVMRGTGSDQPICNGSQHTSSAFYAVTKLDGSMRTAPTMSSSTGTNVYEVIGNSTSTFHSSIDGFQNLSNVFSMRFRIYMNSSGTQGHARWFRMTASADSTKSITASAEL